MAYDEWSFGPPFWQGAKLGVRRVNFGAIITPLFSQGFFYTRNEALRDAMLELPVLRPLHPHYMCGTCGLLCAYKREQVPSKSCTRDMWHSPG